MMLPKRGGTVSFQNVWLGGLLSVRILNESKCLCTGCCNGSHFEPCNKNRKAPVSKINM